MKKYFLIELPIFLKPKKNYFLERIGKDNDGGYLTCPRSINETSSLISLGINDDWSFEENFEKKIKILIVYMLIQIRLLFFYLKFLQKNLCFFITIQY
jgi:hypothetical protein